MEKKIPYKIYLEESELPRQWYNVRADMKNKPAPLLNPATLQPITFEELRTIFCDELARQELNDTDAYIDIPKEIRDFYKCTARHRSSAPTVWKKNWTLPQKFTTNLRETTLPAATN